MFNIVLVLHNIRSTYNVGAITRTAECLGVNEIYATGYTAYTESDVKKEPPFVLDKMRSAIHKTALGAELSIPVKQHSDINLLLADYKNNGFKIVSLEKHKKSINLTKFQIDSDIILILGEEVNGIEENIINKSDIIIEIPMLGKKESFNVSVATGIALYELRRPSLAIEQ